MILNDDSNDVAGTAAQLPLLFDGYLAQPWWKAAGVLKMIGETHAATAPATTNAVLARPRPPFWPRRHRLR